MATTNGKKPFTNIRNLDRWPAELSAQADVIQYVWRCNTCKTFVPVNFGADSDAELANHQHGSK